MILMGLFQLKIHHDSMIINRRGVIFLTEGGMNCSSDFVMKRVVKTAQQHLQLKEQRNAEPEQAALAKHHPAWI